MKKENYCQVEYQVLSLSACIISVTLSPRNRILPKRI